jgi:hydrogenase maturation protease
VSDVLLLGIGNILLGDDGLGSWFASSFPQRYRIPPNLEVIEGGTLGLELLDCIAGRRALIVVDAVTARGGNAGNVVRLEGQTVPTALEPKLSTHDIALRDLLAAAMLLGCMPTTVVLCGIEPAEIAPRIGLSAPVRAALPALEELILGELARFGCLCTPSASGVSANPRDLPERRGGGRGLSRLVGLPAWCSSTVRTSTKSMTRRTASQKEGME